MVPDTDIVTLLLLEFVNPALGNPCPDAQNVRIVVNLQRCFHVHTLLERTGRMRPPGQD